MINIKILIITGLNSFSTITKLVKPIKNHQIEVVKVEVSISAFIPKQTVRSIIENYPNFDFDLVMLPGFVQWDSSDIQNEYSINIKKGPEFASDLPMILNNIESFQLSNLVPANKLFKESSESDYSTIVNEHYQLTKNRISYRTFYINDKTSNLMIGKNLPPPIIAEIVNCTEKTDNNIKKKVAHYIDSGADVIDIGCIANKPDPKRVKEIISLIRHNFKILVSIDSMDIGEILAAAEQGIDLILSLDFGNYEELSVLPKKIPIVILPTNIREAYFPKEPEIRVKKLFELTKLLMDLGFKKLIADPLLETPIIPGICNSLVAYFLYKKEANKIENKLLELPLFFGISNVVELMDVDSVGINGLLACIAVELDIGILFTVEHSTKLFGGVAELKQGVKLSYLSKYKKSPPINQGISLFKAKGKTSQELPELSLDKALIIKNGDTSYKPDENGYFKFYVDLYAKKIFVLFYSKYGLLQETIVGNDAESLSKKVIDLKLTSNLSHINYLGRELSKAEMCLIAGKPYIQDEEMK